MPLFERLHHNQRKIRACTGTTIIREKRTKSLVSYYTMVRQMGVQNMGALFLFNLYEKGLLKLRVKLP